MKLSGSGCPLCRESVFYFLLNARCLNLFLPSILEKIFEKN
nr:MAG TPA: HSP70-interacting protein [Caudoviricetes sp.]